MPIKFTSTNTPSTTPIQTGDEPDAPRVIYTAEVRATIDYLVAQTNREVGWFGLVEEKWPGFFLIYKILLPEQEVSGATVDIEGDAVSKLVNEILDLDLNPEHLRYHGHSHVSMAVSPSGTDQEHMEEYVGNTSDYFIRGIYNKKGDERVDLFDMRTRLAHQCLRAELYETLRDKEWFDAWDTLIKERVHERKWHPRKHHTNQPILQWQRATSAELLRMRNQDRATLDALVEPNDYWGDLDDDDDAIIDVNGNAVSYKDIIRDPFGVGK